MSDSLRFILDIGPDGYRVTQPSGEVLRFSHMDAALTYLGQCDRRRLNKQLVGRLFTLVDEADWGWPSDNEPIPLHGDCVYFATSKAFPGTVKIGRSSSLRTRMKTLGKEHGGGKFRPIAYAMTPEMKTLERALHLYFAEHRATRAEFFHEAPVREFLNGGAK